MTCPKILNLISSFGILLNKFILIKNSNNDTYNNFDTDDKNEKFEKIYIDIFNFTERFKKKELKFEKLLEKYREKP